MKRKTRRQSLPVINARMHVSVHMPKVNESWRAAGKGETEKKPGKTVKRLIYRRREQRRAKSKYVSLLSPVPFISAE